MKEETGYFWIGLFSNGRRCGFDKVRSVSEVESPLPRGWSASFLPNSPGKYRVFHSDKTHKRSLMYRKDAKGARDANGTRGYNRVRGDGKNLLAGHTGGTQMPNCSWLGWYKALALLSVVSGTGGMGLSLLHMLCATTEDMIAGGVGLIAGAILFGSGLLSLAILTLTTAWSVRETGLEKDE